MIVDSGMESAKALSFKIPTIDFTK